MQSISLITARGSEYVIDIETGTVTKAKQFEAPITRTLVGLVGTKLPGGAFASGTAMAPGTVLILVANEEGVHKLWEIQSVDPATVNTTASLPEEYEADGDGEDTEDDEDDDEVH